MSLRERIRRPLARIFARLVRAEDYTPKERKWLAQYLWGKEWKQAREEAADRLYAASCTYFEQEAKAIREQRDAALARVALP